MKNKKVVSAVIIIVIAVLALVLLNQRSNQQAEAHELTPFARCLDDAGATFYGTFWCPHCNDQKDMFEDAEKFLPYVECSNPDRSWKPVCSNEGVDAVPLWEFEDGERLSGTQQLSVLAEKTGCELPAGY